MSCLFEMAHAATSKNRSKITSSGVAGCLYCLQIWPAEEVVRSLYDDPESCECPGCWLDTLVPGPITKDFLVEANKFLYHVARLTPAGYQGDGTQREFPKGFLRDSDLPSHYGDRKRTEAPDPGF